MYRAFPNVSPVANKYLDYKNFLKAQATHEQNIKNARGVIRASHSATRPIPAPQRHKQKQAREHQLAMIERENERLRVRISKNVPLVDTRNNYVLHSLNTKKRQSQQVEHEKTVQRLEKLVGSARSSYSTREYQADYERSRDIQRRMSRFSAIK